MPAFSAGFGGATQQRRAHAWVNEKEYLSEHNRRFAHAAAKPEDYHGQKPTSRETA